MSDGPRYCAILRFTKEGLASYVGHLDFARAFDRALRRAQVPVAYTQGFNVHAKISFSPPLSVGAESTAELCAVELAKPMDEEEIKGRLNAQLPEGVRVLQARVIVRGRRSPLADISRAEYEARLESDEVTRQDVQDAVRAIDDAASIPVLRSSKRGEQTVDIRAGIHDLSLEDSADTVLHMALSLTEGETVRPLEVVEAINAHLGGKGEVRLAGLTRVALT